MAVDFVPDNLTSLHVSRHALHQCHHLLCRTWVCSVGCHPNCWWLQVLSATHQERMVSTRRESSILERPRSILTFFPRRTLSNSQQDAYINAVQCLMKTPSKGTSFYDTLENRYDDFVAMHINATRGFFRPSICSVVRRLTYSQEATTRRPLSLPAETALRVRHLTLFPQSL